jgi:hypothetical protein
MNKKNDIGNSIPADFEGWWNARGEWVEEPNQRRNGWSGMMRLRIGAQLYYIKKQCNHLFRSLRHPFGWPTASREYQNILTLKALGLHVPEPVFHGSRRNEHGFEAVLVTQELSGFSALSDQTGLELQAREALAREVGRILGIMHNAHLQHSCLYDKHVMARWQDALPEIALIDLEKLRRPVLPWRAARHDLDQLKRHQFIWTNSEWDLLEQSHKRNMHDAQDR